ncbi:hypothetical protein CRG98_044276 [Punica granatum]|uniref:Uncharacterized protein n=1 Tax=Punica granatum TaxID=22663 RepID=A0A2I0HVM3_PUNGR|nr:hypothetical protein CRG98_044276 [Punica granatum]
MSTSLQPWKKKGGGCWQPWWPRSRPLHPNRGRRRGFSRLGLVATSSHSPPPESVSLAATQLRCGGRDRVGVFLIGAGGASIVAATPQSGSTATSIIVDAPIGRGGGAIGALPTPIGKTLEIGGSLNWGGWCLDHGLHTSNQGRRQPRLGGGGLDQGHSGR